MAKFIEYLLLFIGIVSLFSGMIWMLVDPTNPWLWFSRYNCGVIFLGLYAILKKMDQCGKN